MQSKQIRWQILLPLGILFLAMLACGGFQLRKTPTATPPPTVASQPAASSATVALPTAEAIATAPEPTAVPSPTATQTASGLATGKPARVTAGGGLNVRDQPTTSGQKVGRLQPGAVVTVTNGPTQADDHVWWKIDDGAGLIGWVAAGPEDDPWLVPDVGAGPAKSGGELVNRAIRLGDRVEVTTGEGKVLTVRDGAGLDATAIARVLSGTQFIVRGGPVRRDGYLWWQLEGEEVKGWAAQGNDEERWLMPVEP